MEVSSMLHLSCAILFRDADNTFGSMLRLIVFEFLEGDEIWLRKLYGARFSKEYVGHI